MKDLRNDFQTNLQMHALTNFGKNLEQQFRQDCHERDSGQRRPAEVSAAMRKLQAMPPRLPRQCQHIKSNGEFCGSPALRRRDYCYFHLTHIGRKLRAERAQEAARRAPEPQALRLEIPLLEDANAVQIALIQVIDAVLNERIDNKRAGLVLYALQTASANLRSGADFRLPAAATTAGSYEDFEADYELEGEEPELRTADDEEAAEVAPSAGQDSAADLLERVLPTPLPKTEPTVAPADAANGPMTEPSRSAAQLEEPQEEEETEASQFCDYGQRLLCAIIGPISQINAGLDSAPRVEKAARSQRIGKRASGTEEARAA